MKKIAYLLMSVAICFLVGCETQSASIGESGVSESAINTEGSVTPVEEEKEEKATTELIQGGEDQTTDEEKQIDTNYCPSNPFSLDYASDTMEFDVNNVEMTFFYGYFGNRLYGQVFPIDEGTTYSAGLGFFDGVAFEEQYGFVDYISFQEEEAWNFANRYVHLPIGVVDNGFYKIREFTQEELTFETYCDKLVGGAVQYDKQEKFVIPAELFEKETGEIVFCMWRAFLREPQQLEDGTYIYQKVTGVTFQRLVFSYMREGNNVIIWLTERRLLR